MSRRNVDGFLLSLYPAPWRSRYGDELEALMRDCAGDQRMSWRARGDVVFAAVRERLRVVGLLGDGSLPSGQVRAGALLVLARRPRRAR